MELSDLERKRGLEPLIHDEELSDAQLGRLDELDGLMASQGFAPALTFTAADLPGRNIARAYLSSGDPAMGLWSCVTTDHDSGTISSETMEFETDFGDGTMVQTRNTKMDLTFAVMPHVEVHDHPATRNPIVLKQKHDEYSGRHRAKGATFHTEEGVVDRLEDDHVAQLEHQVRVGRFVRLDDGRHRLTWTNAVRQVAAFLNPMRDDRLLVKVFTALLLVTLPVATVLTIAVPASGLMGAVASHMPSLGPEAVVYLSMLPMVAVGAVLLGLALGPKAVIWAVFVPLIESRVLLPSGVPGWGGQLAVIGLIVLSAQIANVTSNFMNRRRDLT